MKTALNFLAAAALASGVAAFAPGAAAMPAADVGAVIAPQVDQAHAVRVCDRWGRCWWTRAGHRHGWGRPYYGWHGGYGWRRPYHGHGWHRGHRHWR